jgi:hypothetical protein
LNERFSDVTLDRTTHKNSTKSSAQFFIVKKKLKQSKTNKKGQSKTKKNGRTSGKEGISTETSGNVDL